MGGSVFVMFCRVCVHGMVALCGRIWSTAVWSCVVESGQPLSGQYMVIDNVFDVQSVSHKIRA